MEPIITEEDLGLLFTNSPRCCEVLLEDIDSAGLMERQNPGVEGQSKGDLSATKIGIDINNTSKSRQDQNNNQSISLSGLFNAIDGVVSHGGRVLIITTNFSERLYDALIRLGRIDLTVVK